jgi:hypothetical protein
MYNHPILWRKDDQALNCGIINLETLKISDDPNDWMDVAQGNTLGKLEIYDNLDEFFRRLDASEKHRISLGIPRMSYPAFFFEGFGYGKIQDVIKLVERLRESKYEVRAWANQESGNLVVCYATEDMTEDSGWDIYEWATLQKNCQSDGYGLASWFEFCFFGVPIYNYWTLEERDSRLVAVSPDNTRLAFFGN